MSKEKAVRNWYVGSLLVSSAIIYDVTLYVRQIHVVSSDMWDEFQYMPTGCNFSTEILNDLIKGKVNNAIT